MPQINIDVLTKTNPQIQYFLIRLKRSQKNWIPVQAREREGAENGSHLLRG